MVRSTTLRVFLSAVTGFVSFYGVAVLIRVVERGSDWLFTQYIDVFGLVSVVARLVDPEYYPQEEMGSPLGYNIAQIVRLIFWTSVFGLIFFRFAFRPRQPSNHTSEVVRQIF
jgi:hypothetical protein